jgi:hypothetical protein
MLYMQHSRRCSIAVLHIIAAVADADASGDGDALKILPVI